jgi:hypothetical protein
MRKRRNKDENEAQSEKRERGIKKEQKRKVGDKGRRNGEREKKIRERYTRKEIM